MAFTIYLGNHAALDNDPGSKQGTVLDGKYCTTVSPPPDASLSEAYADITAAGGLWSRHSAAPAAWVAVDSEDSKAAFALAELLASHFGCEIRTPDPQEA